MDLDAARIGYRYELMWTVDSLGWKNLPPDEVTGRVVRAAAPGAIVLMHVGAASTDARALPAVLDALRDRGFAFVRVDSF